MPIDDCNSYTISLSISRELIFENPSSMIAYLVKELEHITENKVSTMNTHKIINVQNHSDVTLKLISTVIKKLTNLLSKQKVHPCIKM